MREHEDQVRLLVGCEALGDGTDLRGQDVGQGRQPGDDQEPELVDQDQADGPEGQLAGVTQTESAQSPDVGEAEARANQNGNEHQGLQCHAEGGHDPQPRRPRGR